MNEVESYLSGLDDESRDTLEQIRRTVKELVPQASEAISYGMPAFKFDGRPLAGYAAYKSHCSYFPMSSGVMAELKTELSEYETSKGGFKFPIGEPPPAALIEKLLKARIKEIEE